MNYRWWPFLVCSAIILTVAMYLFHLGGHTPGGGLTADLDGIDQDGIPHEHYTLIKFKKVRYSTFKSNAFINTDEDSYFIAPAALSAIPQ